MASRYFYIDPAALSYLPGQPTDEESIKNFLKKFMDMVYVLSGRNDCRFLLDSVMQRNLLNGLYETGNGPHRMIPLDISQLADPGLKELASIAKAAFSTLMNTRVELINVPPCVVIAGNMRVKMPEATLDQDDYYCEYLYFMIGNECDGKAITRSQEIIVLPDFTQLVSDNLSASCHCAAKPSFEGQWAIVPYHDLEDKAGRKRKQLLDILHEHGMCGQQNDVKVVQAPHSPKIGRTVIDNYRNIPRHQRKVLDLLRYFGLQKIDLRDWGGHKGEEGCIRNCNQISVQAGQPECIEGWLIIDDMSCRVIMHFSAPVASLLLDILGDSFYVKEVQDLQQDIF